MLNRRDGFTLYGKLGVDFSATSQNPYWKMKNKLQLIRAIPKFNQVNDNHNVSLAIVDCSLHTRRIAVTEDYHKKRVHKLACTPLEFNNMETPAKISNIPARQNKLCHENQLCIAPVRRIAFTININYAFAGSFSELPFSYQQSSRTQTRLLRVGQPKVNFDAADV